MVMQGKQFSRNRCLLPSASELCPPAAPNHRVLPVRHPDTLDSLPFAPHILSFKRGVITYLQVFGVINQCGFSVAIVGMSAPLVYLTDTHEE
jgi:hypothetical protein